LKAEEIHTDFLAAGSGGGGMTAAIVAREAGLKALVLEKTALWGGTTSTSGGVLWIPNNHLSTDVGIPDSEEDGRHYLEKAAADADPARREAYLQRASEMLWYMEKHTRVAYKATAGYMDYYPKEPGAKPGGRSLDPLPCSSASLGKELNTMRKPDYGLQRYAATADEVHQLMELGPQAWLLMARLALFYWLDIPYRLRGRQDRRLTLGRALAGRLRQSMLERDIPLWRNTKVQELLVKNGRVTGAMVKRDGHLLRILARRGVLLATGGFAHNGEMRRRYHRGLSDPAWSAAQPGDTGDGIRMGMAAGAAVEQMHTAWWTPTFVHPDGRAEALIIGKSMPGCIFVNRAGERFTNEAAPYEDVVRGQYAAHERKDSIPCFLLFDARVRHEYAIGPIPPGKVMPDVTMRKNLREFLTRADTLEALAGKLGINKQGLRDTIRHFNEHAQRGNDPVHRRGESLHDRYYSDPKIKPNPTLAPIEKPPFYAFPIYPGDLGTKGGLRCDVRGRVLREDGSVIPGLYATGNCAAPALGSGYPGAGSTIGPAMTFGYIAARDAAGLEER